MKRFLFLCLSFFLSLNDAISINGIDVFYEECDSGDKKFRIVNYDISNHRFSSIDYIQGGENLAGQLKIVLQPWGIEIGDISKITLGKDFDSNAYLVRSNVLLELIDGFEIPQTEDGGEDSHRLFNITEQGVHYDKRYFHVYRTRDILRGEKVVKELLKNI